MTTSTAPAGLTDTARVALTARLDMLLAQRVEVFTETTTSSTGDAADRAGNVEAIIRLEELDSRISSLREKLTAPPAPRSAADDDGTVQVGSRITLRFPGETEPEPFLVGQREEASGSFDVITPSSPLGRALLGARRGDEVTYRAASGAALTATLVDVEA